MNLNGWLLRLYPSAWRERYGDEFAALLEAQPTSVALVLDVMRAALDARWLATTGRVTHMLTRLRATTITIFCAYIAFVVAGMGYQKMTEYADFNAAGQTHAAIGVSHTLI